MVSWPDAWLILRVVSADLRPISNSLNKIRPVIHCSQPGSHLAVGFMSWCQEGRSRFVQFLSHRDPLTYVLFLLRDHHYPSVEGNSEQMNNVFSPWKSEFRILAFCSGSMVWFYLVWFYGISTIVGYLLPNPLYTFISNIYDLVCLGFMSYQPL